MVNPKIKFKIVRLDSSSKRPVFDCGNDDLNDFFHNDSIESAKQLLSVTYIAEYEGKAVAFFSISNDAIIKENLPNSRRKRVLRLIPYCKQYSTLPAVKVGRFGVCMEYQRSGIGTQIIDFIKAWFTQGNKTGCRFIVVDAYNNANTLHFYEKNKFEYLLTSDKQEDTRLMFFDLSTFVRN